TRPERDDEHLPLVGEEDVTTLVAVLLVQRRDERALEPFDRTVRVLPHGIDLGHRHAGNHHCLTSSSSSPTISPSTMRTIRSVARPTEMSWVTIRNVSPRSRFSRRISATFS